MSKVRVISQGTTSNYEAFSELVKRMCAHVEEHEPGAEAYECFADETSGQVLWHEMYQDADAFLAHVQGLTDGGLMDELMKVYTIDKITSLVRLTDERITGLLEQFGAVQLHGVGGLVR
ncbi:MAG: hypothetical protein M3N52_08465 [Actinomycetota bacterium]|nr:hypothetical protein [Actinomycetota bacterium]